MDLIDVTKSSICQGFPAITKGEVGMSKRIVAVLMLAMALLGLAACSGSSSTQDTGTGGTITGTAK